jgi:hypothetical protein
MVAGQRERLRSRVSPRRDADQVFSVSLDHCVRGSRNTGAEVSRPASNGGSQHARCGLAQVVRMRITGNRTDSMERRYNIVDIEDIRSAKDLMEGRLGNEQAADS